MEVVLVTAGYDHSIKYWNVLDGTCIHSIQHNESHINRLAISTDKRYLAVAGNPCIRLYDNSIANNANNNKQSEGNPMVALLEGHRSNVTAVGWSWDGRWLWSASEDGTALIWDVRSTVSPTSTIKCQREFAAKYPLCDAALHPDQSELATVDERGVVRVWRVQERECIFEGVPEREAALPVALLSVDYSPDGTLLVCSSATGMLYVYSRSPYQLVSSFKAHTHYIPRVSFTPDGQSICTCSADGTCRLFSIREFTLEKTFTGHQRWVWDCAFSADSAYLLTASSDNTARLFERRSGDLVSVFTGHSKALTCIALNDIP